MRVYPWSIAYSSCVNSPITLRRKFFVINRPCKLNWHYPANVTRSDRLTDLTFGKFFAFCFFLSRWLAEWRISYVSKQAESYILHAYLASSPAFLLLDDQAPVDYSAKAMLYLVASHKILVGAQAHGRWGSTASDHKINPPFLSLG